MLKYHPQLYQRIRMKYIQMSNNNTSTFSANKLNLDDGYNQQHIEMPSFSQIIPHDESYRLGNLT